MIVIADLHLGKTNDSFIIDDIPSQTWDIRKRLETVLARARITGQCIVVAGDIFNRVNPTTQAIAELFKWLTACRTAEVPVYLIAGNHDAGADWTNAQMFYDANLPNVTVITEMTEIGVQDTLEIGGFQRVVVFWSHLPTALREQAEQGHGSVSRYAAARFPDAKFIITHGAIAEGYKNEIFFEAGEAMVIDPEEFPKLQLMVLGHIHDHKYVGPNWVHPGSLTINNFGEVDEQKGWVEVDLKTLKYEWYEFPDDVTPWVHVELDLTEKDETSLDEKMIETVASGAVIKITVLAKAHGVINEAYIRQLFNEYGHVSRFETIVPESGAEVDATKRLSHQELLAEFLEGTDAKKADKENALKMGERIIEEVLE